MSCFLLVYILICTVSPNIQRSVLYFTFKEHSINFELSSQTFTKIKMV